MTTEQKRYRHLARKWGHDARLSIIRSLHSVYDNDGDWWEEFAYGYAVKACHFAQLSLNAGMAERQTQKT